MFERFSDRARKVVSLANQEAQRRNHEYVGTEHILLGLLKEGSGVASVILRNLNVNCRVRLEVEKLVQDGPDMVTMGKLPQTPRAKKVFEYAIEESKKMNLGYVGTEHLLLGLLDENEGIACQVLKNLGLTIDRIRTEIVTLLGCDKNECDKTETYATVQDGTINPVKPIWGTAGNWTMYKVADEKTDALKQIKPHLQAIVDILDKAGL